MSIFGNRARCWTHALLCLALLGSRAAARDRSLFAGAPPPSLPEPNPLSVEVRQGETVQITLSAYSLTSPVIRYRIREKPRLGALSPSLFVNGKTGLATYTPTPGGGAGEDEFTYAVQSEAGVSAPETVKIKIIDSDPALTAPLDLDFGDVVAGEAARRQVTIENIGGGTAEGEVRTPEGWSVEGAAAYKLRGGMKQTFTLLFTPASQRAYEGEIVYTGNPERATDIKGSGVAPVEIGTAKLALQRDGMVRVGSIPLRNRTAHSQTLQVKASPRLGAPESIEVPAGGQVTISVKTRADDLGPVNEMVTVGGGAVNVVAEAIPADLHAELGPRDGQAWPVTIKNDGAPAAVQVSVPEGFAIAAPEHAFLLGHGEKRTVNVQELETGAATSPGKLIASAGENRVEVTLKKELGAPALTTVSATLPLDAETPPDPLADAAPPAPSPGPRNYMRALLVENVSKDSAVLKWTGTTEGAVSWRIEGQTLEISGTDHRLKERWIPLPNVQFIPEEGGISAHLTALPQNTLFILRMTALDAQKNLLAFSGIANFSTPPPPAGHPKTWLALGAAALAGLYYAWRRKRSTL